MPMITGMTLNFKKRVETGEFDDFQNPIFAEEVVTIEDCLVAPPQEPLDRVETSALERSQTIVRIHLPKADSRDVSNSTVEYEGESFRVMGKPVVFMLQNTPTRWNRYLRAEVIHG